VLRKIVPKHFSKNFILVNSNTIGEDTLYGIIITTEQKTPPTRVSQIVTGKKLQQIVKTNLRNSGSRRLRRYKEHKQTSTTREKKIPAGVGGQHGDK
jgi:hypothetical protein